MLGAHELKLLEKLNYRLGSPLGVGVDHSHYHFNEVMSLFHEFQCVRVARMIGLKEELSVTLGRLMESYELLDPILLLEDVE